MTKPVWEYRTGSVILVCLACVLIISSLHIFSPVSLNPNDPGIIETVDEGEYAAIHSDSPTPTIVGEGRYGILAPLEHIERVPTTVQYTIPFQVMDKNAKKYLVVLMVKEHVSSVKDAENAYRQRNVYPSPEEGVYANPPARPLNTQSASEIACIVDSYRTWGAEHTRDEAVIERQASSKVAQCDELSPTEVRMFEIRYEEELSVVSSVGRLSHS